MAADAVRRTRARHSAAGLEKAELWVRPQAKALLKALEDVLRADPDTDAQAARVLARLALTVDLIKPQTTQATQVFSRDEAKAAVASLVKAG